MGLCEVSKLEQMTGLMQLGAWQRLQIDSSLPFMRYILADGPPKSEM